MSMTSIAIKNMVCNRCVKVVTEALVEVGFPPTAVRLGIAEIGGNITQQGLDTIKQVLQANGFELIEDRKKKLIESIKTLVISHVHQNQEHTLLHINFSDYISAQIGVDYTYLSSLFSSEEGMTIEKYLIAQKIERVKELLSYQEFTLSEIAYQMGYSSVHHLSNQFKKITGITPKDYKQQSDKQRKTLDSVIGKV
jgi:AraC family transcriptional regulator